LKKHEADDIAEDEDDGWIEKAGDTEECDDDNVAEGSQDITIFDEEEEWVGIESDDDDDDDDTVSNPTNDVESFIRDVAEIKRKSGEGWMEKMKRIEEKAMKKARTVE